MFLGENKKKKNITSLSSGELAKRMEKVKYSLQKRNILIRSKSGPSCSKRR